MVSQAYEPVSLIAEEMVGMREGPKSGVGSTNAKNEVTASDNISFGRSYYIFEAYCCLFQR